jgi:Domain of unknown function (DUF6378)
MSESSEKPFNNADVTDVVNEVIEGRRGVYGEPVDTFARMAQMVSGLLGHEVHAWQIPLILIITKMVRTNQCPTYSDNSDDIEGYLAIFRELIGEDMVHARSVDEYLGEMARRHNQLLRTDVDG